MAQCFSPVQIKNPKFDGQDKMLDVRCGKCENCIKTLINDWSFRLEVEAKDHIHVHFITLTYDPRYVPLTENGLPTLVKRDTQLFWKKLRQSTGLKIKYFLCGEYGTHSARPHYHAIVYGCGDKDAYQKAWEKGYVHVGVEFSGAAVRYCLKYMYKKGEIPAFKEDDRLPEFRLMSQKLGARYMNNAYKWHYADLERLNYVVNQSGHKQTLPRYFRKKLMFYLDEDKVKELLPEMEIKQIEYQRKNELMRQFEKDKKQVGRVKV